MSRPLSTDFETNPAYKELIKIPKQYLRIPKLYTKSSPLRNKQNLQKARSKATSCSFESKLSDSRSKPTMLNAFYNKIITNSVLPKKRTNLKYFNAEKQRILSQIPETRNSLTDLEKKEALDSYSPIRAKIRSLTKNKLPPSILRFRSILT